MTLLDSRVSSMLTLHGLPHLAGTASNANGDDFELTFAQGIFKTD